MKKYIIDFIDDFLEIFVMAIAIFISIPLVIFFFFVCGWLIIKTLELLS